MTTQASKTNSKTFRKGDSVHLIMGDLNHGLSAIVRRMTVYSCGTKRMVLVDENGNKFAEKQLIPTEIQCEVGSGRAGALVLRDVTDEQAAASALQVAENCRLARIEGFKRAMSRHNADAGFVRQMREDIAFFETQKPCVIWR